MLVEVANWEWVHGDLPPVEAVAGLPCRVVGTRKATPGLRLLEKCAVRVGGGDLISMHALTHSAPTLDLSLELQLAGKR